MKYGLIPESKFEEEALKANPAAKTLFEPILPVLQSRALITAVRLGIFECIGTNSRTAEEISSSLSLDCEVLKMLMRVFECAGYIESELEHYRLNEISIKSLYPESMMNLSSWVKLNHIQWDAITHLEEVVQSGKGIDLHNRFGSDKDWKVYQEAMLETARPASEWVASKVNIKPGAEHMLDIGGSHGFYSAAICRLNPPLQAEVLELAEAVEHASELAEKGGYHDLLTYRKGNALEIDFEPEYYDAVFLGNILHHFTAEQNEMLFAKIKKSLKDEGTIAIWDIKTPEIYASPDLIGDGFALFFRITSSTKCYSQEEYTSWLAENEFGDIKVFPSASHVLITARVY